MSWFSDIIRDIQEAIIGEAILFPKKKKTQPVVMPAPEPKVVGAEDAATRAMNQWLLKRRGRRATELTRGLDLGTPMLGVPTLLGV